MKTYEYKTIDIGFTPHPTSLTPAEILNKEGAEGWRLVAAVQRARPITSAGTVGRRFYG